MKRYVIERDLPGVGRLSTAQFRDLAATSNNALAQLSGKVQWVKSFITDDKTFCVYLADSEALVREHSRLADFPVTRITVASHIIDPMTAFSDGAIPAATKP